MALKLMYITNRVDVAEIAQQNGVDRVWIDLETRGKEERQKGLNSVKSHHQISDIEKLRPVLTTSELLVRINSWYEPKAGEDAAKEGSDSVEEGSAAEIDSVISAGADMIMLPYWKTPEEVKKFTDAVNGRCKTTLLLETKEAVECIDEVLTQGGFDEIHIGLNDLHLSYGMHFMFELLADGTVEKLCKKFQEAGIPYGFGGIAKLGGGLLPAEKVIMEHYRLGSSRVILSRSFCNADNFDDAEALKEDFARNMTMLREYESTMDKVTEEEFESNRKEVVEAIKRIAENLRNKD